MFETLTRAQIISLKLSIKTRYPLRTIKTLFWFWWTAIWAGDTESKSALTSSIVPIRTVSTRRSRAHYTKPEYVNEVVRLHWKYTFSNHQQRGQPNTATIRPTRIFSRYVSQNKNAAGVFATPLPPSLYLFECVCVCVLSLFVCVNMFMLSECTRGSSASSHNQQSRFVL